jgi:hypothetical protein
MRILPGRSRRVDGQSLEIRRLEEKCRALTDATEQWLTLLRDMERTGESSSPRYEAYFRAYIEARQQEKRADLQLFNVRQGLLR